MQVYGYGGLGDEVNKQAEGDVNTCPSFCLQRRGRQQKWRVRKEKRCTEEDMSVEKIF